SGTDVRFHDRRASSASCQETDSQPDCVRAFAILTPMKGSRRERSRSRSGLIAGLLFAILVLAAILAWQAQASMRYQRAAAEKTLRDYAMLSADEFARRAVNELGYYGFYPILTALRREAAKGTLAAPEELKASADETLRPAAELARDTFL